MFFIGGLAVISLILPVCNVAHGQEAWHRQAASERFMTETPQAFIFLVILRGKNRLGLKK